MGTVFVDRDLLSEGNRNIMRLYSTVLNEVITSLLNENQDLLIFPEAGRSYDGSVMSGKIKANWLLRILEQPEYRHIEISPLAVAYDKRIEGPVFPLLQKFRGRKNLAEKAAYYGLDAGAFIYRFGIRTLLGLPVGGNCYLNFGKPKTVEEILAESASGKGTWRDVQDHVIKEVKSLYAQIERAKK